ncbi:MAG: hypothetical protein KDD46_06940 [Bdellovibrionales bacterium]|nr:hypothetical protein [Bdellovibrionales bacterium]
MKKFLVALLLVPVLACSVGKTTRVDIDSDDFDSTETSSKDLQAVAQQMSRAILGLHQVQNSQTPPRIAFADVKNETNEIINENLFIEKMRTLLLKNAQGRLVFLDRELSQEIFNERDMKESGAYGGNVQGKVLGADYFLTGKLSSIDKVSGKQRSTYTRYAFRLTDANNSVIIWEDEYEVKKVGSSGVYDY